MESAAPMDGVGERLGQERRSPLHGEPVEPDRVFSSPSSPAAVESAAADQAADAKPGRVQLSAEQLEQMDRRLLIQHWHRQQQYAEQLERRLDELPEARLAVRELQEKLKRQQFDATRRENILVMKLSTKEPELQDYMVRSQVVQGWMQLGCDD